MTSNLPQVRGEYRHDYNLSPLTWFKVGGNAETLYKPADIDDLSSFLANSSPETLLYVLGAGSNIIFRDGGVEGVVIKLGRAFTDIEILEDDKLRVGAAALNYNVAQFCLGEAIKGFEFLVGIPGTIGGGIAMNAGSYGMEFKDILSSIVYLDRSGKKHIIKAEENMFGYRHNKLPEGVIFVEAFFNFQRGDKSIIKATMDEISSKRSSSQPIKEKTGGSTFANPEGAKAWELIDKAQMRGHKIGGAQISPLHCNFMINTGNATATELEELGELARRKVLEMAGIELKWEIKRVGKYSKNSGYSPHSLGRLWQNSSG